MEKLWLMVLQSLIFVCVSSLPADIIRVRLTGDHTLTVPKGSSLKFLHPELDVRYQKRYHSQLGALRKPSKLRKPEDKKCCKGEFHQNGSGFEVEDLFEPVSLEVPFLPGAQIHGPIGQDIKPVTEHIEDDLKYDFRTKTHSF